MSFLTLTPACIWHLERQNKQLLSDTAAYVLTTWLHGVMKRARLIKNGKFLAKGEFRKKGFLGSGGLARFRDSLWAAVGSSKPLNPRISNEQLARAANDTRGSVKSALGVDDEG